MRAAIKLQSWIRGHLARQAVRVAASSTTTAEVSLSPYQRMGSDEPRVVALVNSLARRPEYMSLSDEHREEVRRRCMDLMRTFTSFESFVAGIDRIRSELASDTGVRSRRTRRPKGRHRDRWCHLQPQASSTCSLTSTSPSMSATTAFSWDNHDDIEVASLTSSVPPSASTIAATTRTVRMADPHSKSKPSSLGASSAIQCSRSQSLSCPCSCKLGECRQAPSGTTWCDGCDRNFSGGDLTKCTFAECATVRCTTCLSTMIRLQHEFRT